ncbi:MAG: hypothetical protein NVV62_12630 [Terricaulis sp.]|nr:hypothetical protein [Terricaulis sp.]
MMTRQDKQLAIAFGDLGCALIIFSCGLFDAPYWLAGLAAGSMVIYWNASRAAPLRRLSAKGRAHVTRVAGFVIIAIAMGSYWLGLGAAGLV